MLYFDFFCATYRLNVFMNSLRCLDELGCVTRDYKAIAADLADLKIKHKDNLTRLEEMLTYNGVEEEVLSSLKRENDLLTSNLKQTKVVVSTLEAQRGYRRRKARSGMSS